MGGPSDRLRGPSGPEDARPSGPAGLELCARWKKRGSDRRGRHEAGRAAAPAWHGLDGPAEPGRTMLFIHAFMPLGGRTLYYPTPTKSGEGSGS